MSIGVGKRVQEYASTEVMSDWVQGRWLILLDFFRQQIEKVWKTVEFSVLRGGKHQKPTCFSWQNESSHLSIHQKLLELFKKLQDC